jgi:hypothetical protein
MPLPDARGLFATSAIRKLARRIGHGAIGWRVSSDYLVALYSRVGDDLEPAAGFEIGKRRGKLTNLTIK